MKGELLTTPKTTDEAIDLIASVVEILIATTPGEAAGRITDEGRKTLLDFLLWRGEGGKIKAADDGIEFIPMSEWREREGESQ